MRKIFLMMIFVMALLTGGCESSSFEWSDKEIHAKGENSSNATANGHLKIDGALVGEATIERGQLEMNIDGKIYIFDKTQEISIDLVPGSYEILFTTRDDFTGEVTLRTLPKI